MEKLLFYSVFIETKTERKKEKKNCEKKIFPSRKLNEI